MYWYCSRPGGKEYIWHRQTDDLWYLVVLYQASNAMCIEFNCQDSENGSFVISLNRRIRDFAKYSYYHAIATWNLEQVHDWESMLTSEVLEDQTSLLFNWFSLLALIHYIWRLLLLFEPRKSSFERCQSFSFSVTYKVHLQYSSFKLWDLVTMIFIDEI